MVAPDVSKSLWELLNQSLLDELLSAEALVYALRLEDPYSLFKTVWGLSRVRAGKLDGLPQPRWPEIAGVLLDAAERDPALVLPHIIPFVTIADRKDDVSSDELGKGQIVSEYSARFIESRATELFDAPRLCKLLAANQCPPDLDRAFRECYRVAREAALAKLAADQTDRSSSEISD